MLTPSQNLHGFVEDIDCCSMLFGKGFGPKPYRDLFDVWMRDFSPLTTFDGNETALGELLVRGMLGCNRQSNEGCLSGLVSAIIQKMMNMFALKDSNLQNLEVVHQTFIPQNTASGPSSADVTVVDCSSNAGKMSIHSIMEVKWEFDACQFPESQACAYASCFNSAGSLTQTWVPTFVLTKNHYQIGVAFKSVRRHWVFSEIEMLSTSAHFGMADVVPLLRFAKFFCWAAQYHRSYPSAGDGAILDLVDKTGQKSFQYDHWKGSRVLGNNLTNKVYKFYSSLQSAQSGMRNLTEFHGALGYPVTSELIEGCGDGMCLLVDEMLQEERVTYQHLIDLTNQVNLLYEKRLVHGDLRLQNVMFLANDTVRLIDFDWSGEVGVAKFPQNVNTAAFGRCAVQLGITGGLCIPGRFDWCCLADILNEIKLPEAARAAARCKRDEVVDELRMASQSSQGIESLRSIHKRAATPNLGPMNERLRQFYGRNLTMKHSIFKKRRRSDSSQAESARST